MVAVVLRLGLPMGQTGNHHGHSAQCVLTRACNELLWHTNPFLRSLTADARRVVPNWVLRGLLVWWWAVSGGVGCGVAFS